MPIRSRQRMLNLSRRLGRNRSRRPVARLARQVRRLQRVAGHPERKNLDTITSLTDIDDVPVVTPISLVAQGDTVSTRDGNRLTMTSLYCRWNCEIPDAQTGAVSYRFWIVQDKRPNGTAMTTTPFLDTGDVLSLNNLETAGRFKVWRDVTKVFGPFTAAGTRSNSIYQGHFYIRFKKPILQIYDGATAVPTSGSAFYLVQVSDAPAAQTGITSNFATRFRFIDN